MDDRKVFLFVRTPLKQNEKYEKPFTRVFTQKETADEFLKDQIRVEQSRSENTEYKAVKLGLRSDPENTIDALELNGYIFYVVEEIAFKPGIKFEDDAAKRKERG